MQTFEKIITAERRPLLHQQARDHGYTPKEIQPGDKIIITEKLDGANASIRHFDNTIHAYSRKQKVTPENNLRGFWEFSQKHETLFRQLPENLILFGEWLIPHSIAYHQDAYQKFYLFDVFDTDTQTYLGINAAQSYKETLFHNVPDIQTVPILDHRSDVTEENMIEIASSYFDQSALSATRKMEGVIFTDLTQMQRVDSHDSQGPIRVKIVDLAFKEHKRQHLKRDHVLSPEQQELAEYIASYITTARIQKRVFDLQDNGKIQKLNATAFKDGTNRIIAQTVLDDAISETPENHSICYLVYIKKRL